jgi:LuxR family transcriptional regulator, maltose regulon positive regulatory protein
MVPSPKIQIPVVPPSVVARPRLFEVLDWDDAGVGARATLVCAPAGLLTALEIGEEPGVMRPFYDLGKPMWELLIGAVGRAGHLDPFLTRLMSAWKAAEAWQDATAADVPSTARGHPRGGALVTPLTVREIEVLRDLPSRLTVEEIAEEHQVSVNTVKTHLRSLYRKLGAKNRRAAVAAAHTLNLI